MTKFGEEKMIVASPKLILDFEEKISDWLRGIIEKGEVDDRDTMLIARNLVASLFEVEDN